MQCALQPHYYRCVVRDSWNGLQHRPAVTLHRHTHTAHVLWFSVRRPIAARLATLYACALALLYNKHKAMIVTSSTVANNHRLLSILPPLPVVLCVCAIVDLPRCTTASNSVLMKQSQSMHLWCNIYKYYEFAMPLCRAVLADMCPSSGLLFIRVKYYEWNGKEWKEKKNKNINKWTTTTTATTTRAYVISSIQICAREESRICDDGLCVFVCKFML